jgi:DNA-binding NarL/FixJ family response regulator
MSSPLEFDLRSPDSTAITQLLTDVLESAVRGRYGRLHLFGPRGSGKTWWITTAAQLATDHAMSVLRCTGHIDDRALPYASLSTLLKPVRDRLDSPEWTSIRSAITLAPQTVDAFEVKMAAFRFLCMIASEAPVCLLLDDAHVVDAESRDVIDFAMRRVEFDPIACVTASPETSSEVAAAKSVQLGSLSTIVLTELLVKRGVSELAAARVASAADGNPGVAVAIAGGLTDQQRVGSAPIAVVPRPLGALADELQERLRGFGDDVCQALVVAAADRGRSTAAVRGALESLGAPASGFDSAEAHGLIDNLGARFAFTDPWVRAVAYHLVAPGSRRAAHRALAAWYSEPRQASERAWHLAAGADGPSDAIADALRLVARDTARRGGSPSAAHIFEQAAELAASPSEQQRNLKSALHYWMDAGSVKGVRRILEQLDPSDDDGGAACGEATHFLDGTDRSFDQPSQATSAATGRWTQRRAGRLAVAAALDAGDHRGALRAIDENRRRSKGEAIALGAVEQIVIARAHRHAGRVRDAREATTRATAALDTSGSFPEWQAILIACDLDVLQGRGDDVVNSLATMSANVPSELRELTTTIAARARLQSDPDRSPVAEPDAFRAFGSGPLLQIREAVQAGVLGADYGSLQRAIELASQHELPIEAGEAQLWLAELSNETARHDLLAASGSTLQRCGVRGWDQRITRMAGTASPAPPRPTDAALDALSRAEFRVAAAVASGLTNREAAAMLLLSVKTVDFHLQQMYRKLGIRSRTELAVRMTNFRPGRQDGSDE